MIRSAFLRAAIVGCAIVVTPAVVRADDAQQRRALELFKKGRADFLDLRYGAAIVALSESLELVESPKSALLLGHALRATNELPRAMEAYERTIAIAKRRPDTSAYQAELDDARKWSATLKEELAELVVVVPTGARVFADGAALRTQRQSDTEDVARAWRVPGPVEVRAFGAGKEEARRVDLPKGKPTGLSFSFRAEPSTLPSPPPPPGVVEQPEDDHVPLWIPGAVVGGVGLVGMGLFIGFGLSAKSAKDELTEKCGTSCPESERPLADRGERDMLIANVSLGVGAAGLATAAILFIVEGTRPSPDAPVAVRAGVAGLDAQGATLRVRFD